MKFAECRARWQKMFVEWTLFVTVLRLVSSSNVASVESSWRKIESFTNQLVSRQLQVYENDVKAILQQSNVSAKCSSAISSYLNDLTKLKLDAFKSKYK